MGREGGSYKKFSFDERSKISATTRKCFGNKSFSFWSSCLMEYEVANNSLILLKIP